MMPSEASHAPHSSSTAGDFSALLESARLGDRESLGQLLQWYGNYLGILANRNLDHRLRRRVNPSDIVQEALLAAHRDFAAFRGETQGELLCWLRTILIHVLHRTFTRHVQVEKRDMRREVPLEALVRGDSQHSLGLGNVLCSSVDPPSSRLLAKERELELSQRLAKLRPDYATVVRMRIIQGMPFQEIGAAMDRSSGAVRMLWLRALDALRAEQE